MTDPAEILRFWFEEHGSKDWWAANPDFDREIADRFASTHAALSQGEGFNWRIDAGGRLAEILVLDQFSRQLYREDARAYAQDGMSLVLAQEAVALGHDKALPPERRAFLYMPFMHSESIMIHEWADPLMQSLGEADTMKAAREHIETLRRFGRYPKRNAALGRVSTPDELAYIAETADRMF